MPKPETSVIVPCFNDGRYLQEALDSVFHQTASNIEIIVIDDGSTDPQTIALIDKLAADARLTVLRNDTCRGPSAARNLGISHARGEYILPLDADDRILPTYIELAQAALAADPGLEIVYCRARWFGLAMGEIRLPPFRPETLVLQNMIFATAMFRRATWEAVGGYSENMIDGMEDYDLWLKIIARGGDVHRLDEVLFEYRVKPKSRTVGLKRENRGVERRAYECLLNNNIEYFCRPENVRILHAALIWRMRQESERSNSLSWRLFSRYLVWLEKRLITGIKRLLGRA